MNSYFIAIESPHKDFGTGVWYLSPRWYFKRYGRIPDTHANIHIEGMEEIMDHAFKTLDGSSGEQILEKAGIEILRNPVWYWQREEVPRP